MASLSDGRFRLLNTSGDPQFDQLMTVEAQLLSQAMSIRPGVFFLDDRGGPNAYATTHSFQQGTRGTVMFGVELAHNEMYSGGLSGNALIGILAHEHGHIAYFESGLDRHNPLMELHADFMAGWWLGMKAVAGHPLVDLRSLARSLFEKGDFSFNSPHHHGTPQQRVAAMQGGAEAAMRGAHSARSAFSAGHSFLR